MATYALVLTEAGMRTKEKLETGGNKVIEFPAVTVAEPVNTSILASLDRFDWIVFPDAFAALYFADALLQNGIDLAELDLLRIAVSTEKTAVMVTAISIHADLIVEGLGELIDKIQEYEGEKDLKVLAPCSTDRTIDLAGRSTANDADVTPLPVYKNKEMPVSGLAKIKTLLLGGAIEEFVVCSITDIETLSHLFERAAPSTILQEINLSATDVRIADQLRRLGLDRVRIR